MLALTCDHPFIPVGSLAFVLVARSPTILHSPTLLLLLSTLSSFLRVFSPSHPAPLPATAPPFYAPPFFFPASIWFKAEIKTITLPNCIVRTQANEPISKTHMPTPTIANDAQVTYHRVVRELLQPANITGGISKLGPIVAPQSMLHPSTLASENERDSGTEQRANAILHSLPAPWTMPIPKLCEVIFESTRPYEAWIDSITCYREPKGVRHEFLVVKIALSDGRYRWIRLDRAVQNSTNIFRLFSQSSRASAQDEATIHSSYSGDIVRDGEVVQHLDVRVHLLSLHILADLLKIFSSEAEFYTLFQVSLSSRSSSMATPKSLMTPSRRIAGSCVWLCLRTWLTCVVSG
ncbi:hypothetical protein FRC09_004233 [Ceratobasidium sp. 395]|nr:hypothetical protein FRC09_004233 [Ceratobasidium sp. 395]